MNEIDKMREECRQKLELEIAFNESILSSLRDRLSEIPDMDMRQIVSLNATLSHHNHKVKK